MRSETAPEDISGGLHNDLNTTDLTGEYEDRHFVVTRGDSRVYMTIARNDKTRQMGRVDRFLLDDPDSPFMMAYALTKPLKLGWTYGGYGIYKFVLQEVQQTENDNQELRIADYYKHFPREQTAPGTGDNGRQVWL